MVRAGHQSLCHLGQRARLDRLRQIPFGDGLGCAVASCLTTLLQGARVLAPGMKLRPCGREIVHVLRQFVKVGFPIAIEQRKPTLGVEHVGPRFA